MKGQSQQSFHFAREEMTYTESKKHFACCSAYNACYELHAAAENSDKLCSIIMTRII